MVCLKQLIVKNYNNYDIKQKWCKAKMQVLPIHWLCNISMKRTNKCMFESHVLNRGEKLIYFDYLFNESLLMTKTLEMKLDSYWHILFTTHTPNK